MEVRKRRDKSRMEMLKILIGGMLTTIKLLEESSNIITVLGSGASLRLGQIQRVGPTVPIILSLHAPMDLSFKNTDPIISFPSLATSKALHCLLDKARPSQPGMQVLA